MKPDKTVCILAGIAGIAVLGGLRMHLWRDDRPPPLDSVGQTAAIAQPQRLVKTGPSWIKLTKGVAVGATDTIPKASRPPQKFLKKHRYWRPIQDFKPDPLCGEAMNLNQTQLAQFDSILSTLRKSAGALQATKSHVTQAEGGKFFAYLEPDEPAWNNLEIWYNKEVEALLGKDLADYIKKSCFMEIDLLTGRFGRVPRLVEFYPAEKNPNSPEGKQIWKARFRKGYLNFWANHFDEQTQPMLKGGDVMENWQAEYSFTETPDYLSSLVSFGSAP